MGEVALRCDSARPRCPFRIAVNFCGIDHSFGAGPCRNPEKLKAVLRELCGAVGLEVKP